MSARPERISVLIPVFECERYLGEAIDSALAQTVKPIEVIVVDDGSTDASAAVARAYGEPVRVVGQPHAGIGAARNRLVREAAGDVFAFLDADDRWRPGALAAHLAALGSHAGASMAFGLVRQFVSPELPDGVRACLRCPDAAAQGFHPDASLIRRGAFEGVGEFRTDLRVGEFIDWLMRAREAGLAEVTHDEIVLERRLHDRNTGRRDRSAVADYLGVVRAAIDRRRGGGSS
ncbi:MAG: glycosyltransferase family A protein [Thermoanaerobaculaceae bacterium]